MSEPMKAILIGAGQRGALDYAPYALRHPHELRFVAVAEPIRERRQFFALQHRITESEQYETWEELLTRPKLAQAALICTQDQMHTQPTITALRKGYDVLLEKPMATTAEECRQLVSVAELTGRQLHVCHVLRYTQHFQTLREIIQSGILGQVINIDHRENVSWWHMAHSYVRGNWATESKSCPMILAKCCHDFDILLWLLDRKCERLSSTGALLHFRAENAPPGAPQHCLDGCPVSGTCPYYAPWIYIDLIPLWRAVAQSPEWIARTAARTQLKAPWLVRRLSKVLPILRQISDYRGWPSSVVALDPTPETLMEALRDGPYGRCVYHCGNDVVDQQVVSMEFEGNLSVTLTMHGHSHLESRTTRIEGTCATLQAFLSLASSWIEVSEHRSDRNIRYNTTTFRESGHGGGDEGLMHSFVNSLREGSMKEALSTAQTALESHLIAFAAENARRDHRAIEMKEYH